MEFKFDKKFILLSPQVLTEQSPQYFLHDATVKLLWSSLCKPLQWYNLEVNHNLNDCPSNLNNDWKSIAEIAPGAHFTNDFPIVIQIR